MHVCKGCNRELADNQFYRSSRAAHGHQTPCKDCIKARVRAYRTANLERVRAYDRWRGGLPHRKAKVAAYQASRAPTLAHGKKTWAARNPEKRKAHFAAQRIPRPETCQRCGEPSKLHRHHPDYSKPKVVEFLCPACHSRLHKEVRNLPKATSLRAWPA
jgi:hypothetical protein